MVGSQGAGHASNVSSGAVVVWQSKNRGRSFEKPIIVYESPTFQDHPWLAVSPSGKAYIAWTNAAGLEFSTSSDGGTNWTVPRQLVAGSSPLDPVVLAADSAVHVLYESITTDAIQLTSVDSTDGGRSFAAHHVGLAPEAHLPGSSATKAGTELPLFGASANATGSLVSAAISSFPPGNGHPTALAWTSKDGGVTWSAPLPVGTGAAAELAITQPRTAVTDDGAIHVLVFAADRNGGTRPLLISRKADSPAFAAPQPISAVCFATDQWLGDFQALVIEGSGLEALWNDGRSGRLEIETSTLRPHES